jgi:protein involved in polysaccharide export with SLBB domain
MIVRKKHGPLCALALLFICQTAAGQSISAQRASKDSDNANQAGSLSELGRENANRVAASPAQIREALIKDPGLLVALKRLMAKEATANGQLVDDADLTDDAIFDRLGSDVIFRSVATRLVQKYGYLLPAVNPDSEIGKQQELILKERARRLVQIEAQEDAESMKPPSPSSDEAQTAATSGAACNPNTNTNCKQEETGRGRQFTNPQEAPGPNPEAPVGPTQIPKVSGPPILQASLSDGNISRSSTDESEFGGLGGLLRSAMSTSRDVPDLQSLLAERELSGARERNSSTSNDFNSTSNDFNRTQSAIGAAGNQTVPQSRMAQSPNRSRLSTDAKTDLTQGNIVRRPSPYSDVPSLLDLYVQVASHDRAPERFGLNILTSGAREAGAISMDLPVGPDYVVGPGDGLAIDLWGSVSQRFQRTVDREGRISVPEAGPVLVSGKTLGDVQLTLQEILRNQFRAVSTNVSLSRLRTIRVYVVGEVVEPGAYDLSSLSSAINVLVAAGGVTERGSLRTIKHYRGKQLIEVIDAYDLLLRGVGLDQKRFESGDSLLVPPVGAQVRIEGMVRRPAVYELRGGMNLEEALDLAGGILPAAALKHVEVERLVAHENRTMISLNLDENATEKDSISQLSTFRVQDGDRIHIFPIAPYNDQAIYLQGHVLRPGRYSYKNGMTVTDLITSYTDLLPEPAGKYAEIIRLNPPDYRPTVESFDLAKTLGNPTNAPKLQPLDTVRIFSRYDFEPAPEVWIDGEVRNPGQFTTAGQAHVRDAIYLAGGVLPGAAMDSAQVFRTGKDGTKTILSVNLADALAGSATSNILLEPHDRIIIHRNVAEVDPPSVYVKGDVANPGRYPLAANMNVQSLVQLAGGLKPSAYSESAILTHQEGKETGASGSTSVDINLTAAMAGRADEDKLLLNGDVLTVRQNPNWNDLGATVTLRGEVQHPGTYGIGPGESLNSVLEKAGGFTSQAYPYGIVLTRREVRDLEMHSHQELVTRVKAEETQLKALPENDADQKNLKLTAIAQTETTLTQLETNLPVGRVVIHTSPDEKSFDRRAAGTPLRNGDVIVVPKKPNYVVVQGQIFNPTAVGFVAGRSANWYLGQAGGFTQLADKKAAFVIRADGSVLAAKNNNSKMWSGNPMDSVLMPGDMIVVPERAANIGSRNWLPLIQSAQVATSVVLAIAYIHP